MMLPLLDEEEPTPVEIRLPAPEESAPGDLGLHPDAEALLMEIPDPIYEEETPAIVNHDLGVATHHIDNSDNSRMCDRRVAIEAPREETRLDILDAIVEISFTKIKCDGCGQELYYCNSCFRLLYEITVHNCYNSNVDYLLYFNHPNHPPEDDPTSRCVVAAPTCDCDLPHNMNNSCNHAQAWSKVAQQ